MKIISGYGKADRKYADPAAFSETLMEEVETSRLVRGRGAPGDAAQIFRGYERIAGKTEEGKRKEKRETTGPKKFRSN